MIKRVYLLAFAVVPLLAALAQAQTFTILHKFADSPSDGAYPYTGRLALDNKTGTLYGTTYYGGFYDYGIVFSVTTAGTETPLYDFTGGADGGYPFAPVIRDSQGSLYGTAAYGGSGSQGVVFKLSTGGSETVLHSFAGGTSDGCYPNQGVVMDKKGNLYGTAASCGSHSQGTIFKIDTAGEETILHNFAGGSKDGAHPFWGSMLMDKNGDLYGVTEEGGSSGYGTLYEFGHSGKFSLLHSFAGGSADGCYPFGTPALDGQENLYGTTYVCGAYGFGTVWKVSPSGTETILHNGNYNPGTDCDYYGAGVTFDQKGNLYGLTRGLGGGGDGGCLYELSSSGTLTILHQFTEPPDGEFPWGDEVLLVGDGELFGATYEGGNGPCNFTGCGTVWSYVP